MANTTVLLIDHIGQYVIACPHCTQQWMSRFHARTLVMETKKELTPIALNFTELRDCEVFAERLRKSSMFKIVTQGRVVLKDGYLPHKNGSHCHHIPIVSVEANPHVYRRFPLTLRDQQR